MTERKRLNFEETPFEVNHEQTKHAILISNSKGNYMKPHSDILIYCKGETITRVNGNVSCFAGKRLQNF